MSVSSMPHMCTVVKNLPATAGNMGSVPGSGRSPEGGNGNPLQYSCLGNSMESRAWQVPGVAKSARARTHTHTHTHTLSLK